MRSQARVVVIGGGVVGASVLYHLTKLGWSDVLLIERSELTSGSTWHAAGGFHTLNGDTNMAALQGYTIRLYREREEMTGLSCGLHHVGGITLADTPERLDMLRAERAKHRVMGLQTEILTPAEVADVSPITNIDGILGALYDPLDGHLDPSGTTMAYAKAARMGGAEIVTHTMVTATREAADGWEVETDKGTVTCEHVVNAAGLWAREVGAMAGVYLPLHPMEHETGWSRTLALWAPGPRAAAVDFELHSRLGYGAIQNGAGKSGFAVWHAKVTAGSRTQPPSVAYQPLVAMVRPDDAVFLDQIDFLANYSELRGERATEIVAQLGAPNAFLGAIARLDGERTPRTLEFLAAVLRLAGTVSQRFKASLAVRRPVEYSPQVQPMIGSPGHGSLPSGHATEAFAAAIAFAELLDETGLDPYRDPLYREQLMRLASRIAINRTIAGVHFPVDSAAGCTLGLALGHYAVARMKAVGDPSASYEAWMFDGSRFPLRNAGTDTDFRWRRHFDVTANAQTETADGTVTRTVTPTLDEPGSAILKWMWDRAIEEWT